MGEPILQNVWIIWSPILHFNLKGCIDPNSFIHYISMYYARFRSTFLTVFKFLQTKNGRPNFWREPILPNVWIIWSAFLYFNLKSSRDLNSSSFIRFQSLFHESAVLFSESWNFYKLKRGRGGGGDLISGRNQFCRISELFGPPFGISILKVLWTKILRHLLHFNVFYIIQEAFFQSLETSTNQKVRT